MNRPRMRGWIIAAGVAAVVCWSAPLIDQVVHRPGNFVLAYRLATDDHRTTGATAAWNVTSRALGVVPTWAKRAKTPVERLVEPSSSPPRATAGTAVLILAVVAVALLAAVRARRHAVAVALVLSLLQVVSMVVVAASIPAGTIGLSGLAYVLTWTSPAGMFVWLTLAWATWVLSRPVWDRFRPPRLHVSRRVAEPVALVAVAAVAAATTGRWDENVGGRQPPGLQDYRLIGSTTDRVAGALAGSPGVHIRVPITVRNSLTFQSAILYALRRKGVSISLPHRLVREAGSQYSSTHTPGPDVVMIADGDAPIPSGSKELVRVPEVMVTLSRLPRAR